MTEHGEPGGAGGGDCTGGPVELTFSPSVFCDVDRITGTVSAPDMTTVEVTIDKKNPSATLQIPSGKDREAVVRVYTVDDPGTPKYTSPTVAFCVDEGQPVTLTVNVGKGNNKPQITGVTPAGGQVTAGQHVTLTATASDPDGCDKIKTWSWSTAFGTITGSGASADWVPRCPSAASCQGTVALTVADGRGGSASGTFAYTIGGTNQPPTVSLAGVDTTIAECWGVNLTATASDPDGDVLTYAWRLVSGPGRLANVSSAGDSTATWDSQCATGAVEALVEVTVTDPAGASATATRRITRSNTAPTVSLAGVDTVVGKCWGVSLTATASDPQGDSMTYAWRIVSGPGRLINISGTGDNTATWDSTCVGGAVDTLVEVKVTDPGGLSATATRRITRSNTAPTVSLAGANTTYNECWGVDLTATASDPDGDALTYTWLIGTPAQGSLHNISGTSDSTATWAGECTIAGVATSVTVTVTDPGGLSATATVYIVNNAPTVSISSVHFATGSCWGEALHATASDPDGDAITAYAWRVVPVASGGVPPGSGGITGTGSDVTYDNCTDAGPATVEVTVQDARGAETTAQLVVPVPGPIGAPRRARR